MAKKTSGLKLLEGGLELSNVGILSVFAPEAGAISAQQLGDRIRKIRTLLGLGLSFAEIAVLEALWFLNRYDANVYQRAIFANNTTLAHGVSQRNRLFRGIFHPSLLPNCQGSNAAPLCVFRLADGDPQAYAALEEHLVLDAHQRGILFERGGSFGFRGHRFQVVRPEDGTEPFLRVTLGRRTGWSYAEIVRLMTEVAQAPSVPRCIQRDQLG